MELWMIGLLVAAAVGVVAYFGFRSKSAPKVEEDYRYPPKHVSDIPTRTVGEGLPNLSGPVTTGPGIVPITGTGTPTLTINGINYPTPAPRPDDAIVPIVVRGPLKRLVIEAVDVPHPEEDNRDEAANRIPHGGAYTGFGTGYLEVSVPRKEQARVTLSSKTPEEFRIAADGTTVADEGVARTDELASVLVSIHTAPSRQSKTGERVDTPVMVRLTTTPSVKAVAGVDARFYVRFVPADGSRPFSVLFWE